MNIRPLGPLFCVIGLSLAAAPALAESRLEKSFKLEPGGELAVDTDIGRVVITGVSGSGARLLVTSRRDLDELLRFDFQERAGRVSVVARKRHRLSDLFFDGGSNVRFEIEVPSQTRATVHTSGGAISLSGTRAPAKLDTSGGGIEVRDLAGDLEADTSGGGIRLRDIKGSARVETSGGGIEAINVDGPLKAETSGGSVRVERVTGNLRAHSSGGGIHIREAGGRVDADTSGGSIEATFTRGNSRGGSLETSGGGISVALDPSAALSIDASGNSVSTDLPITVSGEVTRRRLRGTLGKGGESLRLHTSGGSVRIRAI